MKVLKTTSPLTTLSVHRFSDIKKDNDFRLILYLPEAVFLVSSPPSFFPSSWRVMSLAHHNIGPLSSILNNLVSKGSRGGRYGNRHR
jgi:hypothetical protein